MKSDWGTSSIDCIIWFSEHQYECVNTHVLMVFKNMLKLIRTPSPPFPSPMDPWHTINELSNGIFWARCPAHMTPEPRPKCSLQDQTFVATWCLFASPDHRVVSYKQCLLCVLLALSCYSSLRRQLNHFTRAYATRHATKPVEQRTAFPQLPAVPGPPWFTEGWNETDELTAESLKPTPVAPLPAPLLLGDIYSTSPLPLCQDARAQHPTRFHRSIIRSIQV